MPENTNSRLEAAKALIGKGFSVFPLHSPSSSHGDCSCGKRPCRDNAKHPRTEHGHKDASTNLDKIQEWWTKWPNANIGIATGKGFVVLDVDPRHGGDESLRLLEEKHGAFPQTVRSLTGGNGEHIFFRLPEGVKLGNRTGILSGLDTRGDGGYIVAPPSLHASGRSYEWEASSHPDEVEMAMIPEWLLELLLNKPVSSGTVAPILPEVIPEGQRNPTLFNFASGLRAKGLIEESIFECLQVLNNNHCSPKLDEKEVRQIAKSVNRYDKPPLAKSGLKSLPQGITAKELMAKTFPPINWVIPGVLPEGLCLFVGGSKIGKSWFALALAIAVASGKPFWDNEPLPQGEVLYIALEDYDRGLQDRLLEILDEQEAPDGLKFYFEFLKLDAQGKQQLIELIDQHPGCKVLIIDTLGRSRPSSSTKQNIYDTDTNLLGDLQKTACEKRLCIIFVHHTRKDKKSQSGDPFEEISGSTGLMGTADTTLLLSRAREESQAVLRITGRAIKEQTINLSFENCRWTKTDPPAPKLGDTAQKILSCFKDDSIVWRPKQVTEATKLNHDTVKQAMNRMAKDGVLLRLEKGFYKRHVTVSPKGEKSHADNVTEVTPAMSPEAENVTQLELKECDSNSGSDSVTFISAEDVTYEDTDYESLED